jgi:pimeloyl-ACP methyl ester carboxylesterase
MRPTYTRTRLDGFRLHAVHRGEGPPVILLHGLSGSHRWWRFTVPALESRFRVHVPEMIGFGGSRGADRQPGISEMAALMVHWLDAAGIERTSFVGHSMGAQVGVHLAARWPDRIDRLVLTSAAGVPRSLSPVAAARFAAELAWPRAWGRPLFFPTIAADAVRTGPRTLLSAIAHVLEDDIRPLLPHVETPTLLIWGEHDPFTPLRDGELMARRLPDARLVVLKGAAHNPMADRPGRFNAELIRFLDHGRE